MRKWIGSALLLSVLALLPAFAAAQRRAAETGPKNELGVDLAFQYVSLGSNAGSGVQLAPGINVLHQLKRGSGTRGLLRAPYVTAGVGLNIVKPFSGAGTETQFAIGGGVGRRVAYGSAVFRPEGYISYAFSSGNLPSAVSLGVRLGLSFWH
jgi:hypothetical protein